MRESMADIRKVIAPNGVDPNWSAGFINKKCAALGVFFVLCVVVTPLPLFRPCP
jgi:hypothetical protein